MEKVMADQAAANARLEAQANLNNQLALLQTELSQYQANVESFTQEIQVLNNQIAQLDKVKDASLIASLTVQKEVASGKKKSYESKIAETKAAIEKLKKSQESGGNTNGL